MKTKIRHGDFVLYRDPEAYLTGAENHTKVCRVDLRTPTDIADVRCGGPIEVRELVSGERHRVSPDYVRRIDPAEVMRDIDTAPLHSGDVSGLESAATVWLRQQDGARINPGRTEER